MALGLCLTNELAFAQAGSAKAESGQVQFGEREFFSKGSFSAFAFTFAAVGQANLAAGSDYEGRWSLDPNRFPDGAELTWKAPSGTIPGKLGVWGYHHIDFGNYDQSVQKKPVPPAQICSLRTFTQSYKVAWTGSERFNLLAELWLTPSGSTTAGNSTRALLEVGFLMHSADPSFHDRGRAIGTDHTNAGIRYTVRQNGKFVTFAPVGGSQRMGTIDWGDALRFLAENGVVTGAEWVNGVAFGVEPLQNLGGSAGSGTFSIEQLSVAFSVDTDKKC